MCYVCYCGDVLTPLVKSDLPLISKLYRFYLLFNSIKSITWSAVQGAAECVRRSIVKQVE